MSDNVLFIRFDESSKAYEALSALRIADAEGRVVVRSAGLLRRDADGRLTVPEGIDGVGDDGAITVGLVGLVVGVLGGPLGMLLGGSLGALIGSGADADRRQDADAALGVLSGMVTVGQTVLAAELSEPSPAAVDDLMAPLGGQVVRRSSADVYAEVQAAQEAQAAADREARRVLKAERKAERRERWEQFKDDHGKVTAA